MPHDITTTYNDKTQNKTIIPLSTISLPNPTSINTIATKIYIYIPKFEYIHLSQGKNFENGFWSINFHELSTTNIIITPEIQTFQLLLVYKDISEDEIVCNLYYSITSGLIAGPFITASYNKTNTTQIALRILALSDKGNTIFEITGIPNSATLNHGKKIEYDDNTTTWQIPATKSQNIEIKLSPNDTSSIPDTIDLSIIATNINNPQYKTCFTLIINLNDTNKTPHKSQYREKSTPLTFLKKVKFHSPTIS